MRTTLKEQIGVYSTNEAQTPIRAMQDRIRAEYAVNRVY